MSFFIHIGSSKTGSSSSGPTPFPLSSLSLTGNKEQEIWNSAVNGDSRQIPPSNGTNLVLSWQARPASSYRVHFKNSVSESNWQTLAQQITIANGIATAENSFAPQRQRFYRIVEE